MDSARGAAAAREPLRRHGALMAVDPGGVLRGVVTIEQVRRALQSAVARRRRASVSLRSRTLAASARIGSAPAMPSHDVLIIGAGLAGQRAALAAADAGAIGGDDLARSIPCARTRSPRRAASTPRSARATPGSRTPATPSRARTTSATRTRSRSCAARRRDEILHLEHLGVTFHRDATGHLGTRAFGGASAARTVLRRRHHRPGAAARALRAAHEVPREGGPLRGVVRHVAAAGRARARCTGAIARNIRDGRLEAFNAKS